MVGRVRGDRYGIPYVKRTNDNAPSYPDDFFQLQVKKNADIIADQSEIRLIALENAEAKSDDENKVVIDTFTTIELAELRAELAMVKSELAEVRAELATVKANQSHFDDFAQRNEHRIELDQSQCIHHMKEVELRAELATVKANQSRIRAQLLEHSATLNEQIILFFANSINQLRLYLHFL